MQSTVVCASEAVFPARAGMSRVRCVQGSAQRSVPRASGDEPGILDFIANTITCSPRERG